jgi:hypothetical protein
MRDPRPAIAFSFKDRVSDGSSFCYPPVLTGNADLLPDSQLGKRRSAESQDSFGRLEGCRKGTLTESDKRDVPESIRRLKRSSIDRPTIPALIIS